MIWITLNLLSLKLVISLNLIFFQVKKVTKGGINRAISFSIVLFVLEN